MESFLPRFADGKDALENVLKKDALPVTSTSPLLKNKFVKDSWCHQPELCSRPKQKPTRTKPTGAEPSKSSLRNSCLWPTHCPFHPTARLAPSEENEPISALACREMQQMEETGAKFPDPPKFRRERSFAQEQILRQP